ASTMSARRPVISSSASATMRDTSSPTVGMWSIRPIAVPPDQMPASRSPDLVNLHPPRACDEVLDVFELAAAVEDLDHLAPCCAAAGRSARCPARLRRSPP